MIITIASKTIAFSKDILLAYYYGASQITDAYIIGFSLPGLIFGMIGTGLGTTFIPLYSEALTEKDASIPNNFTNNVINMIIIFCTIVTVIVFTFPEQILAIFASGFGGETLDVAVGFTRIGIFGIYFTGLMYVFQSLLQIKGNYIVPAIVDIPLNMIIMISIVASFFIDVKLIIFGSVIGLFTQLFILVIKAKKYGFTYSFSLDLKDQYVKNMIFLAIPVILGSSTTQINQIVDRTIASQIAVGGISALNYALKLDVFIKSVFIAPIVTVLYPTISGMGTDNKISSMKKLVNESIIVISLLVIPATIGAMVFAKELVMFLFGRGAFDEAAVLMTSSSLFFYSVGMLGFGIRTVLTKVFYSLKDTKTPMINSSIAMLVNIILNIVLSRFLGVGGLALASSIAANIAMLLMIISLKGKIGALGLKNLLIKLCKIALISLMMGLLAKFTYSRVVLILSQNYALVLSIITGFAVYIIMLLMFKIDEANMIMNKFKEMLLNR